MPIVSISLPERLLEAVDEAVRRYGFTGRSELVREALRQYLRGLIREEAGGPVYSVLVVQTDHTVSRKADQKVVTVLHEYQESVLSFHHQFLDENRCINIAVVKMAPEQLQSLLRSLRSIRGVTGVWVVLLD